MDPVQFFATPADALDLLRRVGAGHPVRYARCGVFRYADTPVYDSVNDLPDFGRFHVEYLLLPPGEPPPRREQWLGGVKSYAVSPHKMPPGRGLALALPGFDGADRLCNGSLWFPHAESVLRPFADAVLREMKCDYAKRRQWRLSPEVQRLLGTDAVRFVLWNDTVGRSELRGTRGGRVDPLPPPPDRCWLVPPLYDRGPFAPAWLTADVLGIARTAAAARDFAALPVLADALEEAGCDNAAALAHLRHDGPHVLGCWVLEELTSRG